MIRLLILFCAAVHFGAMGGLTLYGLHRLWLLALWSRVRRYPDPSPPPAAPGEELPVVTVQLPLYNERFVAARLLDATASLDWPAEKLEIQVLDDSTDDTRAIVDERVGYWAARGVNMRVLRRAGRSGYKAGALAWGLARARGERVAVFDADFLPPPEFLKETTPHFRAPDVGMVQTRWGFGNADDSWLTRIQALLLEPHFAIEHRVRCHHGRFFNFNGTAGIWRKEAIESAGGWQADTVTEDLDLSYRAQLAGWRFVYLDDVVVASELPVTIAAFRGQQQRWAKGSVQTARKLLPRLFAAPLSLAVKVEGSFHLLANFGWLLGALTMLTLFPVAAWRTGIGPYQLLRLDLLIFLSANGALFCFYLAYGLTCPGRRRLRCLPLIPLVAVGLAPSLALAVLDGAVRRGGVFERTPKFGTGGRTAAPGSFRRYHTPVRRWLITQVILAAYCLLPLSIAIQHRVWTAVPLAALFPAGLLLVSWCESRETAER
ncbi:MAG: glycosyltransferase family 2 protein [Deferrisomatales bacterium]|nr:glycosyltransferase family 2 protein [Deferrisomatales bacterium]